MKRYPEARKHVSVHPGLQGGQGLLRSDLVVMLAGQTRSSNSGCKEVVAERDSNPFPNQLKQEGRLSDSSWNNRTIATTMATLKLIEKRLHAQKLNQLPTFSSSPCYPLSFDWSFHHLIFMQTGFQ